jgi:hypothetical protein
MTRLLFVLVFLFSLPVFLPLHAQKTKDPWERINELVYEKKLPKTALAEVQKLYAKAKKEKQPALVIKALIYMVGLKSEIREEAEEKAIAEIEKERSISTGAAASILTSMLAEHYWLYAQHTEDRVASFDKNDISTWKQADLYKKTRELYRASIENKELLQQTPLSAYDTLILKGDLRYLRPTLYDLLAQRALAFFTETDYNRPTDDLDMDQPEAFTPAKDFVAVGFPATSDFYEALAIYQQLIAFHLRDARPDALIDADLDRLEFVKAHFVVPDKEQRYLDALEELTKRYGTGAATVRARYVLANFYVERGYNYRPLKDTVYRYEKLKAQAILEKIVVDSAVRPQGWVESYELLQQLHAKDLSIKLPAVNISGQPFLSLLNYRNIAGVYFRLVSINEKTKYLYQADQDAYWKQLLAATPLRQWQQSIPDPGDLQEHTTEVKIDALPAGNYVLLASYNGKFSDKGKHYDIQAAQVQVSRISYVRDDDEFFVLDRETGQPLAGAIVQVWKKANDPKTSRYTSEKAFRYTTDAHGFCRVISQKEYFLETRLDISYRGEHFFADNSAMFSLSVNQNDTLTEAENEARMTSISFFTDRSIYRPGQTVFFKGIVTTQSKSEIPRLRTGFTTVVYLRDANEQNIDSLKLKTNEYGSFSGRFQLTRQGLTGIFSLATKKNGGAFGFSVEEYKRPKFSVSFDTIRQSFHLGQQIHVRGKARAFAGNNVTGAAVTYNVIRRRQLIYDWSSPSFNRNNTQIAHGTATTDSLGYFTITFNALADRSIDTAARPLFDFDVAIHVTDINGETQNGGTTVTVGYQSIMLNAAVEPRIPRDSLTSLYVNTQNMAGIFQPARVQVNIYSLIPEQRLVRTRLWERPDQYTMSREEFIRNFPHDEWAKETEFESWPRRDMVLTTTATTRPDGLISIGGNRLPEGYYAIDISTQDDEGRVVKTTQYVELFDPKQNQLLHPEYLWTQSDQKILEPGEEKNIRLGTGADIFLIKRTYRRVEKEQQGYEFEQMNATRKTYAAKATEADRGGYSLYYFFVRDNRFYQYNCVVSVDWDKDLKVEYASFRDKTLPGSEERWKVKITGSKSEAVTAEVLASMYDASLDDITQHAWSVPVLWPYFSGHSNWSGMNFDTHDAASHRSYDAYDHYYYSPEYDKLPLDMESLVNEFAHIELQSQAGLKDMQVETYKYTPPALYRKTVNFLDVNPQAASAISYAAPGSWKNVDYYTSGDRVASTPPSPPLFPPPPSTIQARKNLNETAFFFPNLYTDSTGGLELSFTAPEALTRWKLQTLAHTRDLSFGLGVKELVTQKQLMVQPNLPRFLRQGDHIELSAKIANLSDSELTGQAQLELIDATTGQSVDGWFLNTFPNQYFTVAAHGSEVVHFPIQVPMQFTNILTWRITASTGGNGRPVLSDGEEDMLPVVSNRALVTETLPLPMKGSGTRQFRFEKLLASENSETLQHQSLTVEYTSNPAWYVVQALPYLMNYPYECAEQTWNRFYANVLAATIVKNSPAIRKVLDRWQSADTSALLSNLQKNEELKLALLNETPWVLDAQSEATQKKNISLLYQTSRLQQEGRAALDKLNGFIDEDNEDSGFPWFKGGYNDRYITQYILTGIGRLKKLGGLNGNEKEVAAIVGKALPWLDKEIREDYDALKKKRSISGINEEQVQYLYLRSFFPNQPLDASTRVAVDHYRRQAASLWTGQAKSAQAMIALVLERSGNHAQAQAIVRSLQQTSIYNEEQGRYWKDNSFGFSWNWWMAPIETQALLIEAFTETGASASVIDELRTWLIKNKQTNNWNTTRATADACYALLLRGKDWLGGNTQVHISLGPVQMTTPNNAEAGTGYFKQSVDVKKITPALGEISVTVAPAQNSTSKAAPISWGSVYWKYFEDMDKITSANTPLRLQKKLMLEKNGDHGPELTPVTEGMELHVGDKLRILVELKVDRDMDYVQLKDTRASVLEAGNALSGYQWQEGLGYYQATGDMSTSFFFDHLPRGTYVFDYPVFVSHTGDCSNGIATIQCLYAPEFSAHSEGSRVVVVE